MIGWSRAHGVVPMLKTQTLKQPLIELPAVITFTGIAFFPLSVARRLSFSIRSRTACGSQA